MRLRGNEVGAVEKFWLGSFPRSDRHRVHIVRGLAVSVVPLALCAVRPAWPDRWLLAPSGEQVCGRCRRGFYWATGTEWADGRGLAPED